MVAPLGGSVQCLILSSQQLHILDGETFNRLGFVFSISKGDQYFFFFSIFEKYFQPRGRREG